ncbi:MAG: biotin/lipoyl-binding protein [Gammaproteobacteria bacterium]|nr:biotin/lipoyl-binding protein [Gammaproteobacteria bacterium]
MTLRFSLKYLVPILILLLAGGIYHVLLASKPDPEKPVLREKVWQIRAIDAIPRELAPSLTLYGRVESPGQLQAAAPGGGIVDAIYVRDGARVATDQLLVTLDERDFAAATLKFEADLRDLENQIAELQIRHRANLASLETERELLALSRAEVERLQKLQQQNLTAESALNSARSEYGRQELAVMSRQLEVDRHPAQLEILRARLDRARAQLDEARLAMSRSELRAPFDAIVSHVGVAAGDRVAIGQTLISLFPVDNLEIRAHLPSTHIAAVQQALALDVGLQASVIDRPELGPFELRRLAGEAEATGIDAFFEIGGSSEQMRPGELLTISLALPPLDGVYAVPYQAIYGNSRLYRVVDERLDAIDVRTVGQARGAGGEMQVLVRSDQIAPGDAIAVTHLPNAVSGLKVRVQDD